MDNDLFDYNSTPVTTTVRGPSSGYRENVIVSDSSNDSFLQNVQPRVQQTVQQTVTRRPRMVIDTASPRSQVTVVEPIQRPSCMLSCGQSTASNPCSHYENFPRMVSTPPPDLYIPPVPFYRSPWGIAAIIIGVMLVALILFFIVRYILDERRKTLVSRDTTQRQLQSCSMKNTQLINAMATPTLTSVDSTTARVLSPQHITFMDAPSYTQRVYTLPMSTQGMSTQPMSTQAMSTQAMSTQGMYTSTQPLLTPTTYTQRVALPVYSSALPLQNNQNTMYMDQPTIEFY